MVTAQQTIEKIVEKAKEAKNEPLVLEEFPVGCFVWQGDIRIDAIERLPVDCIEVLNPPRQIAPGTSPGSRHIINAEDFVEQRIRIFKLPLITELDGPIIKSLGTFTVEHPEHGDITMPGGVYTVTYQRQHAEELRRVRD